MATAAVLVSVEEYLATVDRPDCEYVDGVVLERNVGELDHSRSLGMIACSLFSREKVWETVTPMSVRVQVRPGRISVPDISVIARPTPKTRIVVAPPLLCVEVLSPGDRMVRVQESVRDYLDLAGSPIAVPLGELG